MENHVKVVLPEGEILIELLQTPVVEKWLAVRKQISKLNIPTEIGEQELPSGPSDANYKAKAYKRQADSVAKINNAIDNINEAVDGKEFPYRAHEDMPWMQTNRLHRCFTTSSITEHCWHHNLAHEQLLKCKTIGSSELRKWVRENTTPQFTILDRKAFHTEVHIINAAIHHYEGCRYSEAAQQAKNNYKQEFGHEPRKLYVRLDRDYSFNEEKTCLRRDILDALELVSFEELISSFPDNYEDYNVAITKSIGGKDYETCWKQYDDPFEFDIRNIEAISGGFTIYPNKEHYNFFVKAPFYDWINGHDLRDELFLKVPIGKVIDSTIPLQTNQPRRRCNVMLSKRFKMKSH